MKISVIIPTYRRLNDLKRCLIALDKQELLPHEVIVVVKSLDAETLSYIAEWCTEPSLYNRKFCTVTSSGVVHAMTEGVKTAVGEVVAFTDDDSAPEPTWLLKMKRHYRNPKVGGVGGRDILINHPVVPLQSDVGKLTWYGKLIGNHHLGYGEPREVDVLKGVNMSFRKHLVEFSPFLRGNGGPENHNEVGLCLRIKCMGYALVYDPSITVDHHVAPRIDSEQRTHFKAKSTTNSAFNLQRSLLTWLPWHQKLIRLIYSTWIGDKGYPGLMRLLTAGVRREVRSVKSFVPTQVGFFIALMHYCRGIWHIGSTAVRDSQEIGTQHKMTMEDI